MAIACRCPACRADLKVAEKHAGRKVKCPKCAGAAMPAKDLRDFLKKHLPQQEEQSGEAGQTRLEWDEINRIVSPSMVMIVKSS